MDQLILVEGIGSEHDTARYGPKRHPITMMEGIAKQIAVELVHKSLAKSGAANEAACSAQRLAGVPFGGFGRW